MNFMETPEFPMRINRYLAHQKHTTRRGADALIEKKLVIINGRIAVLGDKVNKGDVVEVSGKTSKKYSYYAYHKPKGVVTHSAGEGEEDIGMAIPLPGVFPIGRLDKESHGLIILTDDGRITDPLLNPEFEHEKEYHVRTVQKLRPSFSEYMEKGVDIGGYITKPCKVEVTGVAEFSITISEGKRHQIRRMCAALHVDIRDLERVRIMNIKLGTLPEGNYRKIEGKELTTFMKKLGF